MVLLIVFVTLASSAFASPTCKRGDANGDTIITLADVIYLVNYIFKPPWPAPNLFANGDVNCIKGITLADVIYLVNYIFGRGPAPCIPLEVLTIQATSPHLADDLDSAQILVTASDSCSNPVTNAGISLLAFSGIDIIEEIPLTNNLDGTYSAKYATPLADSVVYKVYDTLTFEHAFSFSSFLPGNPVKILIGKTDVRDKEAGYYFADSSISNPNRNLSFVYATALDSNGNMVPNTPLAIQVDRQGIVDSVAVLGSGFLAAIIRDTDQIGEVKVTVSDTVSGLTETTTVVFPAISLTAEGGPSFMDSTLKVLASAWANSPLAYYDMTINFDASVFGFDFVTDGNLSDDFGPPLVQNLGPGSFRMFQSSNQHPPASTGLIDMAEIYLSGIGQGNSDINVSNAWLASESTFLPVIPVSYQDGKKVAIPCTVCVKVYAEAGSGITVADVKAELKIAQEIFDAAYELCCHIHFKWDEQITEFATADYDKGKKPNGKLDVAVNGKSAEEKALLDKFDGDPSPALDRDCINVFYFTNDLNGPGLSSTIPPDGGNCGIVWHGKAGREFKNNKKIRKVLAHEFLHAMGWVAPKKGENVGTEHLTESGGASGVKLWKELCTELMASKCVKCP